MSNSRFQLDPIKFQLQHIAGLAKLQQTPAFSHVDDETINLILEQAGRFADTELAPLAASGDIEGCSLKGGRVTLPAGSAQAYQSWCELGFPLLGIPLEHDGMGFPRTVLSVVQEVLDGANLAFGMLGINLRCAALALIGSGTSEQCERWLPGLASGEIASTIVISEPQAGSDVGRILTTATPGENGQWTLKGTKIWISYADHDATPQILHLVLARVPNGETGTRGLGLFMVPRLLDESTDTGNSIHIQRLEHKMGLHASPTCVMELDQSTGWLLGEAGKGLQALFVMMNAMRQAVSVQGAAVAAVATGHAIAYARERPQGGHPLKPPVMLTEHADVRRMLLEMTAHSELARALSLRTASFLDLADTNDEAHADSRKIAELLLPVAKTCCSEIAFQVASQGIQVLGGYGYTNDYPLERLARDIRVTTIYEGTSGIQAMDFLKRKVLADKQDTLNLLLDAIRSDCSAASTPFSTLVPAMAQLLSATLDTLARRESASEAGAYASLQLTAMIVHGWNAHCLLKGVSQPTEYELRLTAALQLYAAGYQSQCQYWADRAVAQFPDYGFEAV